MRGLALCLVFGALVIAGCGSNDSSSNAPKAQNATTQGTSSGQSAAVSAAGRVSAASLCAPEGQAKLKKKCAAGMKKLKSGKIKSAAKACKGLSKKKTKGVKGKSPYAVCVSAAAKLLAAKANANSGGNGSADSNGNSSDSADSTDSSDSSTPEDTSDLVCTDAEGNVVSVDDPNLDD